MTVHAVDVCLSACLELDGDLLSNSHKRGQTGALGFKPCYTHQQVTDKNEELKNSNSCLALYTKEKYTNWQFTNNVALKLCLLSSFVFSLIFYNSNRTGQSWW